MIKTSADAGLVQGVGRQSWLQRFDVEGFPGALAQIESTGILNAGVTGLQPTDRGETLFTQEC